MSIFAKKTPCGSHERDVPLDKTLYTRTPSVAADQILFLLQELKSKNGVPIVKFSESGQAIEKTLHVDPSGLFLVYSPSVNSVVEASAFIPNIAEFRGGCVSMVFRKVIILPERMNYCFSLFFKEVNDVVWSFSFQNGNLAIWKNAFELLMKRANTYFAMYPLKLELLRLWYNVTHSGAKSKEENQQLLVSAKQQQQIEQQQYLLTHNEPAPPSTFPLIIPHGCTRTELQYFLSCTSAPRNLIDIDLSYFAAGSMLKSFKEFASFLTERLFGFAALQPLFTQFTGPGESQESHTWNGPRETPNLKFTVKSFMEFASMYQFEDFSPEEAERMMKKFALWNMGDECVWDLSQFCAFLLNPIQNSWMKPSHQQVYHDMTQPLSHYYISTSHNSYLTGDQLQSESSTEMYRLELLKSCRCVELDCWDGDEGDPVVYHGHTRTSKISFESVIETIEENAFLTSPFPVILSLEVHTSSNQQHVMAVMMKNILRDKLLIFSDEDFHHIAVGNRHFSPESLKYKVLVKSKRKIASVPREQFKEEEEEDFIFQVVRSRPGQSKQKSEKKKKRCKENDDDDDEDDDEDEEDAEDGKEVRVQVKRRLLLPDVVTVPAIRCVDIASQCNSCHPCQVSSFGETRLVRIIKEEESRFIKLNCKMLSRIYPKGSRINSSNYDPQPAWNVGAQLVALNFQTLDFPLRLNEGRFQQNGACGYLLKPSYLRHSMKANKRKTRSADEFVSRFPGQMCCVLYIRLICGHLLPKPNLAAKGVSLSPLVKMYIVGVPEDDCTNVDEKRQIETARVDPFSFSNSCVVSNVVEGNGFNPVWLQEFSFRLQCIELATLVMRVYHRDKRERDIELAEGIIPVSSLRLGYRAVSLRCVKTNQLLHHRSLLCHFSLQQL